MHVIWEYFNFVMKSQLAASAFKRLSLKQNWIQFLLAVKDTTLQRQISKFYPQIPCTEASYHISVCQQPDINR